MKIICELILLYLVSSHTGFDAADPISDSNFQCFINSGYDFVIFRGYRSNGQVEPSACDNLNKAQKAGISNRNVYLFHCVPCGNPTNQVNTMINALSGCPYDRIFLDIEQFQWKTKDQNRVFVTGLIDALINAKSECHIYTNKSQWETLFGLDFTYGSKCKLWYARWNGVPDFSDFQPFSGWAQAEMKQYEANKLICSTDIDINYSP